MKHGDAKQWNEEGELIFHSMFEKGVETIIIES